MTGRMTLANQALEGLDLMVSHNGIVRVRDGHDTWLCLESAWDEVIAMFAEREADGEACEAYSYLCFDVRGPIASINGHSRGDWQSLVQAAYAAGLIDAGDAKAFGAEVQR